MNILYISLVSCFFFILWISILAEWHCHSFCTKVSLTTDSTRLPLLLLLQQYLWRLTGYYTVWVVWKTFHVYKTCDKLNILLLMSLTVNTQQELVNVVKDHIWYINNKQWSCWIRNHLNKTHLNFLLRLSFLLSLLHTHKMAPLTHTLNSSSYAHTLKTLQLQRTNTDTLNTDYN